MNGSTLSIEILSHKDAETFFEEMKSTGDFSYPSQESETRLRYTRDHLYNKLSMIDFSADKYQIDLEAGLILYRMLPPDEFGLRNASEDGVWRYFSLIVLPDIVHKRWESNPTAERFWKNGRRIWLKTIWWYIHLSWQGCEEQTRQTLQGFSTDTIVQLVERVGRYGYREKLYREIIRQSASKDQNQFRSFMKLNTAAILSVEPELCNGSVSGYVERLYNRLEDTKKKRCN